MSAKRHTNAQLEREVAELRAGAYKFAAAELSRLRSALRAFGVHDSSCQAYRVIGRFGSRSGMRWNEAHDAKTCTCGLGKAIRG